MAARVLIVKNVRHEGPGLLRDVLQEHHISADVIELDRGDMVPALDDYAALFVMGGPASANDNSPIINHLLQRIKEGLKQNVPILGICLGMQLLVKAAGGSVIRAETPEVGWGFQVEPTAIGNDDPLFAGIDSPMNVFHLHGETVTLSDEIALLATGNGSCENQIIKVGRRAYGIQGHFEIVPEMLAVWGMLDDLLSSHDVVKMQQELGANYDKFTKVAKRLFANFLSVADLTRNIDITEIRRMASDAR